MWRGDIPLEGQIDASDEVLAGLFPLEAQIVTTVHNAGHKSIERGDTAWTVAIKDGLGNLAASKGLLQFPNQFEDNLAEGVWQHGSQWMLDLVWLAARRNENGTFDWRTNRGLVLACESEWQTGEYAVLEDFQKLTVIQADIRLFIYTNHATVSGNHPVDVCKQSCTLSRGFRFVTVGFPKSISEATKSQYSTRVDAWTA